MKPLRPTYTALLLKELNKQSLNVYGERGQGQWRLLMDLQIVLQEQGDVVFLVNMKNYAESHAGFIADLKKQLAQSFPDAAVKIATGLAQVLTALEKCAEGKRIVLLLHDFDAILNNPQIDPKYGVEFFNHLNALRNQGNRLVCITESPHSQAQVFVDQKVHGNSWLDLKKLDLPPLSTVELKNELLGSDLNLDERQINCIVDAVKQEPQAYALLEFILTKIRQDDSAGLKFNKRLKKWHKIFVAQEKSTLFKGLHGFNLWVRRFAMVIGLNKLKTPFSLLEKVVNKFIGKT